MVCSSGILQNLGLILFTLFTKSGSDLLEKKDMIYLVTDKGYFVDTSVEAHGGTEWKAGETYHSCRITPSKRNTYPYWIQKK